MKEKNFGKVLIIGKTNVGKSTLFNQLMNEKLSIISRKKNTTNTMIIGIYNKKNKQCVFIDTPGFIENKKKKIEKKKIQETYQNIKEVQIVLYIISKLYLTQYDIKIIKFIKKKKIPYSIIINKIDLLKNKKILLPFLENIKKKINNLGEIFLISAKNKNNVKTLKLWIINNIPQGLHLYNKNQKSLNTKKNFIKEIIRETLINSLYGELPYSLKISVSHFFKKNKKEYVIHSIIYVLNIRHKKILLGKNGEKIKFFSIKSREKLEKKFKKKIHLILFIKIIKKIFKK